VTGDPVELHPGAGVKNELSSATWRRFRFSDYGSCRLACFSALVRAISSLPDYTAMVISHNLFIGGRQGALCAATLSNRHEVLRCTKKVEITLAEPTFDPQRQISRKFFWCPNG
jgi:hypothetical protein